MSEKKTHRGGRKTITEDTPLTPQDYQFVLAYINAEVGSSERLIGEASSIKIRKDNTSYTNFTRRMLRKPNIVKEINRLMAEKARKTIAEANDVMEFFTRVMNNEEKDQFGLDAALADRIKAGQELAKRTVDVELRKQGLADNQVNININWGDPFSLPDMIQPQEPVGITLFSEEGGDEDE